ncbi:uncharacterized protein LOC124354454 isoform X1 [Homalodisca vitripennis]|uniref:uncharacterized protein LOC124354454 isoform X1 n=2 Tax=Homalodisca vitripennis TaxID=197043 RepID=UPI001EEB0960|nr:uncharacterized protein LOC124354454 isoform X1 [Homalodisca vitripennis]XP_046660866.1 uncharacterized protein LOC124354454 isoform X1 [Homalodisca vitripennis]
MLEADIRSVKKSQWSRSGGGRWSGDVTLNMKLRYALIFLTALAIVTYHHVQKEFFGPRLETMVIYENYYANERDPEVSCQFPILHPFDESILPHVKIAKPIRCFARNKILTMIDEEGYLKYNKSGLVEGGYDIDSPPSCYFQEIFRAPKSDFDVIYSNPTLMKGCDQLQSDFVFVECYNFAGISIYQNFHASVQRNQSVRKFKNDVELSVAVIGLDSMSRLNFMRQLPLSYRYITDVMEGVVLLGFNKVGENTFPNLVPMLTGRASAWGAYYHYENWPFVWKQFADEGAATMYSEDLPQFNMFDYLSTGLQHQPTVHYMRTFWLAVEKSLLYRMSSTFCLGARPKHVIYFHYLLSFLRVYRNSPAFLFSLFNEASHDYVNTVGAIDQDLRDFLNASVTEGLFNRTVVLILGDHGNRIDPIRLTDVGRIEDRMPMVSVVMPKWTDKIYPGWREALQKNSKRLLSSYDIHGTFLDVLSTLQKPGSIDVQSVFEFEKLKETGLDIRWAKHFSAKSPEMSFFQPVPLDRTCSEAGIPDWFCVCQTDQEKLSLDDARSISAAQTVVKHFNEDLLHGLTQCATQELTAVESAVMTQHRKHTSEYRVQVMFRTRPGDGVFEASVDVKVTDGREERRVVGELLRINRYGSQADCLPAELRANSTILRGVCYCK